MNLFNEEWLRSVPVGLVLFLGTVFGFVRRAWVKRAARSSFPQLARRLGLQHSPAETPGAAGVLKGRFRDHLVRVESDSRARVVVALDGPLALDLRNYERWVRLPPGHQPFFLGDRYLDGWLRTRLASSDVAAAVADDAALPPLLHRLRAHSALREFSVNEGRVEVVYDFGARGLFPVEEAEKALLIASDVADRLMSLAVTPPDNADLV